RIQNLSLSLVPEGAPSNAAQTWSAESLKAGSRLSWRMSILSKANHIWNLQLSYLDPAGRPVQISRQLGLERAMSGGLRVSWLAWLLCIPVLAATGWLAWRGSKKYRPLLALGFDNLRKHRVRTGLTSLGIILGTAAIGATMTLSLAFRTQLIKDFATFGTNRL